jgi:hypothetical protein
MRIDYGGAVIPWYERPLAGGFNYTWEEKPPDPPPPEVQQYVANETYIQEKMQEGNGGIGGFLTNYINPVLDTAASDPIKTAAMLVASVVAPELIPIIAGADTAIAGGTPEDILKSAATAYVSQAVGGEIKDFVGGLGGADISLPSETPYVDLPDGEFLLTPNVPPPALPDDASRLAQMLKEFENPTELTGPTIDTAGRATVTLEDGVIDSQVPVMPSNLQDTAYLDPGLIDVAPENVTIETLEPTPYFDASPTFPTLNVSPEYDPNAYLPTNLGGFDNIPNNLGTNVGGGVSTDLGGLDVPFNTSAPTDLSAGELTVSGNRNTFDPWDNPEPPPYTPFEENFPIQEEVKPDTTAKTNAIKLGNLLKSSLQQSALTQQKLNLSNALRGSQMPQTALPSIYKQPNPFNFGQQNQPVQDTNALVKLLRTA